VNRKADDEKAEKVKATISSNVTTAFKRIFRNIAQAHTAMKRSVHRVLKLEKRVRMFPNDHRFEVAQIGIVSIKAEGDSNESPGRNSAMNHTAMGTTVLTEATRISFGERTPRLHSIYTPTSRAGMTTAKKRLGGHTEPMEMPDIINQKAFRDGCVLVNA